jgi:hypothetical protein
MAYAAQGKAGRNNFNSLETGFVCAITAKKEEEEF